MISQQLPMIARRSALLAAATTSRAAPLCHISLKALGSQANRIAQRRFLAMRSPDDSNNEGPLAENLDEMVAYHLDEVFDTTNEMEDSMEKLKDTHTRKRQAYESGDGAKTRAMASMFDKSAAQQDEISRQIARLSARMANARKVFAVDAPDGTPDYEGQRNLKEIRQLIDYEAENADVDEIFQQHEKDVVDRVRARKIFAVDAPDGTPDYEIKNGLKQVARIVDFAAEHEDINQVIHRHQENRNERAQAKKIRAVDAPDGTSDDELKSGLKAVDQIIAFAAEHENLDMVNKRHQMEQAEREIGQKIFAVDSPDGSSDFELERGMREAEQILNYAAGHEDVERVKRQHALEQAERELDRKIFAVDAPDGVCDYEIKKGLKEIDQIIDDAAKHEDSDIVNARHKREEVEREMECKNFAARWHLEAPVQRRQTGRHPDNGVHE